MNKSEIIEYSRCYGQAMMLGSRDSNLNTEIVRGFGFYLDEDLKILKVFVPKQTSVKTIQNLNENGRISLTVARLTDFITLQFKGSFIESNNISSDEKIILEKHFSEFTNLCSAFYGEDKREILNNFNLKNMITISLKIEEIFNQTPGPNAGKKINY